MKQLAINEVSDISIDHIVRGIREVIDDGETRKFVYRLGSRHAVHKDYIEITVKPVVSSRGKGK